MWRVLIPLLALSITVVDGSSSKRVLLISFDGFRFDLLNSTMAPYITEWASSGSWFVNGVQSQYVTYTAPNHMSIITGLREDAHGVVSNYFYDPETKEHFDLFNLTGRADAVNASLVEHWFGGEPIWITNQKGGGKSVVMYWPAGEAIWKGQPGRPTFHKAWTTYGTMESWVKDVDQVVDMFEKDQKNTFAALYVAEPDHTLHSFGFYFENRLTKKISELDQLFRYITERLKARGLLDTTDIILTADHGHAEIKGADHVMCIPDYVSGEVGVDFEVGDHMIYPTSEQHATEIYDNLTKAIKDHGYGVNVYYKKDLPERFHYVSTPRVGEIVFEPKIGWAISLNCTAKKLQLQYGKNLDENPFHSSTHGMDPIEKEMRALLVMKGPSFVEGKNITEIPENIDLYGLMAHLLNVKAAPNNGSMHAVTKALRGLSDSGTTLDITRNGFYHPSAAVDSLGFVVFVVPSVIIVGLFFIYAWRRTVVMEDPTWALAQDNRYKPLSTTMNEAFDYSPPERRQSPRATNGQHGLLTGSDSEDEF